MAATMPSLITRGDFAKLGQGSWDIAPPLFPTPGPHEAVSPRKDTCL
jgi:hypothetical protein